MKIRNIELDEDEAPALISVVMTRREAEAIVKWAGAQNDASLNRIGLPAEKYQAAVGDIYDGLAGGVFNRFWDDGVGDAIAEREVR